MTKIKTKTLTQRVADLEKENAELRELVDFMLKDFSVTQGQVDVHSIWLKEIREEEERQNSLPPPMTEEDWERDREARGY